MCLYFLQMQIWLFTLKNDKFSNIVFLKMHPEQKVITAHYTKGGWTVWRTRGILWLKGTAPECGNPTLFILALELLSYVKWVSEPSGASGCMLVSERSGEHNHLITFQLSNVMDLGFSFPTVRKQKQSVSGKYGFWFVRHWLQTWALFSTHPISIHVALWLRNFSHLS